MSLLPWRMLTATICVVAACQPRSEPPPASSSAAATATTETRREGTLDWVIAGGGSLPENNDASIEADLGLARQVLGGTGRLLLAGGPGSLSIRVEQRQQARVTSLRLALGDLFDPRDARRSRYRRTRISPDGPATFDALNRAIAEGLRGGEGPLRIYLAGHGDPADTPGAVRLGLWGNDQLTPADLAAALDAAATRRPVQVVMTSCYSGGFAEIAFDGGDASRGIAATPRCGLFATTWDLPASGCDPDPDRRRHQGYGIHFLQALVGRDRLGRPLASSEVDIDGDGAVSLLEAHSRARVAARGFDVPTTTSERFLRAAAPAEGPLVEVQLPEEDAVIAALGRALGPGSHSPTGIEARISRSHNLLAELRRDADAARREEDAAAWAAMAGLLSRWPVLNDPWHPHFDALMTDSSDAIAAYLATDAAYARYLAAVKAVDRLGHRIDDEMVELAPWLRLARAHETRRLAGRLAARGGDDWEAYNQLLACERELGTPARRTR